MKIKKELKEFKKFKKIYNFNFKKIFKIGDDYYVDDILIQTKDEIISESEKWINVGYKLKGSYPKLLSNLFPYEFKFKGKKLSSIESFFQGIKFKDKNIQNKIFKFKGIDAVNIRMASNYNWRETKKIYWQGKEIDRESQEYSDLIDELYISAIQNPLYRNVLTKCTKDIIHTIGDEKTCETVFTRYEFEFQLNCLKDFLKK